MQRVRLLMRHTSLQLHTDGTFPSQVLEDGHLPNTSITLHEKCHYQPRIEDLQTTNWSVMAGTQDHIT